MKRWVGLLLVFVLLAAAAYSGPVWLPPLLGFISHNTDLIQGLADAIQLLLWLGAGAALLLGLWRGRTMSRNAEPQASVQGGGAAATGGGTAVGRGGVNVGEGVGGDVVTGLKLVHAETLYQVYLQPRGKRSLSRDDFDRMLGDYLDWVIKAYGKARLYGLESLRTSREKPKRSLAEVFVPLSLQRFAPPRRQEIEEKARQFENDPLAEHKAFLALVDERRQGEDKIALDGLLQIANRLAVIGAPGCGKSTLLAFLAAALAEHERRALKLPFQLPAQRQTLLPLLIPLRYRREYLNLCAQTPGQTLSGVRSNTLAGFILWYLKKRSQAVSVADEELAEEFFDRLLLGGGCLVMLDGLDEVANAVERGQVRAEVERLVEEVYPGNAYIVTAREAGYKENAVLSEDFTRLDVLALDDAQIQELVERWCRQLYPEQVAQQTEEIFGAVQAINQRYRRQNQPPLVNTPLMTTMVVSVKWGDNELPRERARLYEAVIKVILQAQYLDEDPARQELVNWGGPWEQQRDWLAHLALEMQRGGQQGAAIAEERLRQVLAAVMTPQSLEQFILALRGRGGLLEERAGLFQFGHLTFQEFLAARLLAKQRQDGLKTLARHIPDPWWRETLLLVYGFSRDDYAPFAQQYLNWLSQQNGDDEQRLAGLDLAGAALLEIERPDPSARRAQAERLATDLFDRQRRTRPAQRARAGDTLAALGDPRFDPERWFLPTDETLGFIHIPAGPFLMGSDKKQDPQAYDDETPQHEVTLPDYYLGRYPVTVAQFQAFVQDSGYPPEDPRCLRDPLNRPVRYVTWHEARRYCTWLGEKLRPWAAEQLERPDLASAARSLYQGLAAGRLRPELPSEAEWEKAARGPNPPSPFSGKEGGAKRLYPWGDEFDPNLANTDETGIGTTSSVGCFPGGAGPYGHLDLSGNLWEWTRSLWGKDGPKPDYVYPYFQDIAQREDLSAPDSIYRVLRGGSFGDESRDARCAFRDGSRPSFHWDRGFRVALPLSAASGASEL